jgi:ribA/ribD-fused uncharacterized protein
MRLNITGYPADAITRFDGDYHFLSNFYPRIFSYEGVWWPTAEHAYQAMKSVDSYSYETIRQLPSAGAAKKYGRKIEIREDWEDVKISVMRRIVAAKFRDRELATRLWQTGNVVLVEGNYWGDTFWGVDYKKGGENVLGKILMEVRSKVLDYPKNKD